MTDNPLYILTLDSDIVRCNENDINYILVSGEGNPFHRELPDHACAEKLRVFKHLPPEIEELMFIDLDILVINNFWDSSEYFKKSNVGFVACPDLFVGYKEKMEDEFRVFDSSFQMKYFPNGDHHYFNTGVFFASRSLHSQLFDAFLEDWERYVTVVGQYPSIFDQNMINYCLIKYKVPCFSLPLQNNCLRQYGQKYENGVWTLNNEPVNALHFNGGTADLKISRWREALASIKK